MTLRVIGFNSTNTGRQGTSRLVCALLIVLIAASSLLSYGLYKEHKTNQIQVEQLAKQNEQINKIIMGFNNMVYAIDFEFNIIDQKTRDLDNRVSGLEK